MDSNQDDARSDLTHGYNLSGGNGWSCASHVPVAGGRQPDCPQRPGDRVDAYRPEFFIAWLFSRPGFGGRRQGLRRDPLRWLEPWPDQQVAGRHGTEAPEGAARAEPPDYAVPGPDRHDHRLRQRP